jgi:DNA primase
MRKTMAKTYIDTVKYVIKGNIKVDGIVEKPDIVGAIFGQTEGLLGDELDLRELQKSGRIGRIEVDVKTKLGKTAGGLTLPSSLDKEETSILAATLETVDRVGPCVAEIDVTAIEDTRAAKRDFVVKRAQKILSEMVGKQIPESREITDKFRDNIKTAKLVEYGPEKLAGGPDVEDSEEVIVVEGRADVLNVLKAGIKNVISIQGSIIPKTVIELSKRKSLTVFVDGDRGGDLIVKQMAELAKVDFVVKAPDGKEVEELTKKEITQALRKKIPVDEFTGRRERRWKPERVASPRREEGRPRQGRAPMDRGRRAPMDRGRRAPMDRGRRAPMDRGRRAPVREERSKPPVAVDSKLEKIYKKLGGSMKAALVDEKSEVIEEVPVGELINKINKGRKKIYAIVFDGIITQRLADSADNKGIKYVIGLKQSRLKRDHKVEVVAMEK